jgi:hypothetical protein
MLLRSRWLLPVAAIAIGSIVIWTGVLYDVEFAGIPYQDPTPEMESRYRYHSNVASTIQSTGTILLILGMFALLVVAIWSSAVRANPGTDETQRQGEADRIA